MSARVKFVLYVTDPIHFIGIATDWWLNGIGNNNVQACIFVAKIVGHDL